MGRYQDKRRSQSLVLHDHRPQQLGKRVERQQALETLRHCVYLDKDLVLPPMWESGASETFFVVASVDMEHAGIMSTRIRKLLERIPDLTAKSTLTITSAPVELGLLDSSESLEMRVERVAGRVTEMIMASIGRKSPGNGAKNFN